MKRVCSAEGSWDQPHLDANPKERGHKAQELYQSLQQVACLPDDMLVLSGHASEPVAFDDKIVGAPLHAAKTRVDALQLSESRFVERVTENVRPTPPNHKGTSRGIQPASGRRRWTSSIWRAGATDAPLDKKHTSGSVLRET